MADLTPTETTVDLCCTAEEQTICCEPEVKVECCGHVTARRARCDCSAGAIDEPGPTR